MTEEFLLYVALVLNRIVDRLVCIGVCNRIVMNETHSLTDWADWLD